MFKTALNKNIIPHTWKLANIVPIPKPNKDADKGTSYRPISLLSVIAKTLEFNQMAPPARTITVALDMSKAFDTINIHTLIRKLLHTNIPDTIIKFIANYINRRNPTQHIEITHPNNVNLKLAFHKVASFHPHYSTLERKPPPNSALLRRDSQKKLLISSGIYSIHHKKSAQKTNRVIFSHVKHLHLGSPVLITFDRIRIDYWDHALV